jgi:hypothetical protein
MLLTLSSVVTTVGSSVVVSHHTVTVVSLSFTTVHVVFSSSATIVKL